MKYKTYCFDLDGTLCLTYGTDYANSKPISARISGVNKLYDSGATIFILTARGFLSGLDLREFTEAQLSSWGVKFHKLFMGKPAADVYIDDKAKLDTEFFTE